MIATKCPSNAADRQREFFDVSDVKAAGQGRGRELLVNVAYLPADSVDGRHHPCPKCGGTDRFRVVDIDAGAVVCNGCAPDGIGDYIAAAQHFRALSFPDAVAELGRYLGVKPKANGTGRSRKKEIDPAKDLEFQPWNEATEMLAQVWCLWKPPITLAAIKAAGGCVARYSKRYNVIALPVWGPELDAAPAVGWVLYNLTGGELPRIEKDEKTGKWVVAEWLKVKLTAGSKQGVIADLNRLRTARVTLKVEGPSDLLGVLSLASLPDDHAVLTNANGAKERPADWILELIAGPADNRRDECLVIHDADEPGQAGALGWHDDRQQKFRPGWATCLAPLSPTRNVVLPFEMAETHGKDLRDFLAQPATFADLQALAVAAEVLPSNQLAAAVDDEQAGVLEEEDDPHYLAKTNLTNYQRAHGGVIRYWREQFYTWKPSRACYRVIQKDELAAKVTAAIKAEFDRQWAEAYERYREWQKSANYDADADKGPPKARKVTAHLVKNVVAAMRSLCLLPASIEFNTWLDGKTGDARPYIAVRNGLVHLGNVLADRDETDCLLEHSPNWFSTVCLPYKFDGSAECPHWLDFLNKNLEGDAGRIATLQEFAGYCLAPGDSHQKFLAMEGEGGNGKSVFMAGLQAILGQGNCSYVALECLNSNSFEAGETIGKLANFCADVGEIDKLCEGTLKLLTSGDMMSFKRKHVSAMNVRPTARLILSFNNRPRFSDRSNGIWRRMLLVPWKWTVPDSERVIGMDTATWWESKSELPGMFIWALQGLYRLRNQGKFSLSETSTEAAASYRDEFPERRFFREHVELRESGLLKCSTLFKAYRRWCEEMNYKPMNDGNFGKEVNAFFPGIAKKRIGPKTNRGPNHYSGIDFSTDEICGRKIPDEEEDF